MRPRGAKEHQGGQAVGLRSGCFGDRSPFSAAAGGDGSGGGG